MADDAPEGWGVPTRTGMRAALLTPLLVLTMLALAGWLYETRLKPARARPVTAFPAPGVEPQVHPGLRDLDTRPPRDHPDATIARAMDEVAREGLPGWPAGTRQ